MFLKQETKQKLLEKTGSIRLYVIASLECTNLTSLPVENELFWNTSKNSVGQWHQNIPLSSQLS